MSPKTLGTISIIAALLVLFSAILNPIVSVAIAAITLIGLGAYHLLGKENKLSNANIPVSKQTEEKEQNKQAILDLMESGNQPLTNEHLRQMLGVSEATATRHLDELEKEGKIKQVGKTGAHVFYEKI